MVIVKGAKQPPSGFSTIHSPPVPRCTQLFAKGVKSRRWERRSNRQKANDSSRQSRIPLSQLDQSMPIGADFLEIDSCLMALLPVFTNTVNCVFFSSFEPLLPIFICVCHYESQQFTTKLVKLSKSTLDFSPVAFGSE
uniref:Uncharacterized protein n=1 Tax=Panagrellus redivivus TaxID=6233 RepID=A0A7E4ZT16_PANRE